MTPATVQTSGSGSATSHPARIAIEPTRDLAWMDEVLDSADIYERTRFDGCLSRVDNSVRALADLPQTVFLKVLRDDKAAGFYIGICKAPGVYEVHTNLLPEARGKDGIRAGIMAIAWMFLHTDCMRLTSLCPEWLPESVVYSQLCGFTVDFKQANKWKRDGVEQSVTFVSIAVNEWVRKTHREFAALGRRFHEQLFAQLGGPLHGADDNHDAMVGLVWRMATAGQALKAETIYNIWASIAGYAPARILGERDGVMAVDIQEAIIGIDKAMNVHLIKRTQCQR